MKILTYILSLILSAFIYLMFAAYMTASAGLSSANPLISMGLAILIFGFFSWFHFYKPIIGAILLTVSVIGMYLTWPAYLLIEYMGNADYKPPIFVFLIPMVLGGLTIFFVWKSRNTKLSESTKGPLSAIPAMIGLYFGGYILMRLLGF